VARTATAEIFIVTMFNRCKLWQQQEVNFVEDESSLEADRFFFLAIHTYVIERYVNFTVVLYCWTTDDRHFD
jgi:hypothetical protein